MPSISQRLETKQKLNPKQIMEFSIMQLNSYVLEKRILEEIESNPTIEVDIEEENTEAPDSDNIDFNWEDLISNPEDYNISTKKETGDLENNSRKPSLIEDFTSQLNEINLSDNQLSISELILGNLDNSGYLTIDPILISDKLNVEENEVIKVIEIIKQLDPVGVGSRNIQECILAQINAYYPKEILAKEIVGNYFNEFKNHNYSKILSKLKCTSDEFNNIIKLISVLSPRPGLVYSDSKAEHIIPDISVEKNKGNWQISSNSSYLPKIVINNEYKKMASDNNASKDVKKFLKQKIENANWFIDAISNRYNTIEKIMHSIIKHQDSYFNKDSRELSPLVMKTIAEDIQMDVSTVSRASNDKYVQLPWGCFEIKSFFSEGVQTKDGDFVSNTVVKKLIQEIINKEDLKNPYNDQSITDILIDKKFNIARRTVAKYREFLKIPVARLRKKNI